MKSNNLSIQAISYTLINYVGVFLGMFSTLFIYPQDKYLLGIFSFVEGFAQILYPVMMMGTSMALVNFQPQLSEVFQRKLFSYSLLSIAVFALLVGVVVGVFYQLQWFENWQYYFYGVVLAVTLAYIDLSKKQLSLLQKIAFPTAIEKIVPKIILPVVFALGLFVGISYESSLGVFVGCMSIAMLIVLKYTFRQFSPIFTTKYNDLFQKIDKKHYYVYSLYALSASLGAFFAFRIDSVMIPEFLTNTANGEYRLGVNIANVLMIPATGIFTLYSPKISEYIKNNQWGKLESDYKEVAKGLFFVGILFFGSLIIGIQSFFEQLPTADQLQNSIWIIYLLGGSVLLNMATGFNTEIIAFSNKFSFNLYLIFLLAISNVSLNYILLTSTNWGIIGVAISTLISMTLYNAIKMYYIYKKWNIHPFSDSYFWLAVMAFACIVLFGKLHFLDVYRFGFVLKIALFVSLYCLWVYRKNHIPFFTNLVDKFLKK
ncbi:polysaccharide biosynthesis C-terminal domain-containing protein [Capnocytophaga sp. ARDL2]|uniref:polysaccharide biosynthesis C-terminal domain-containing protein n=1 Tax=Capnocytophaga sp. ARDL2 TaxID=3238809 RepID=UPI003557E754